MKGRQALTVTGLTLLSLSVLVMPASLASAEDIFTFLFRGFGGHHQSSQQDQWGPSGYSGEPQQLYPRRVGDGGPAYCVRSCDGRHFPAPPALNQSRAEACRSLCPATETTVYYGRDIDDAVNERGKAYEDMPNAYKYRTELVANCTCNGRDPVGLASVRIENDSTFRRGDIVASGERPDVGGKSNRGGVSMNYSPAEPAARERFRRSMARW